MRLLCKLAAAALLALAAQCLVAPAGTVDEVRFTARVYLAHLSGRPSQSPDLLEAADRLRAAELDRVYARQRPDPCMEIVTALAHRAADEADLPVTSPDDGRDAPAPSGPSADATPPDANPTLLDGRDCAERPAAAATAATAATILDSPAGDI